MRTLAILALALLSQAAAAIDAPAGTASSPSDAGFPEHFKAATSWYARWGDAVAGGVQRALGRLDERTLEDPPAAARWYAKAARHGDAEAQFRLGLMYFQGSGGLRKDPAQGSRLVHAAAEAGHVDAQGVLGLSYLLGQGVRQNLPYAYMWVSLASEIKGGPSVRTRDLIAKVMPRERLPQALELARRCKEGHFLRCDDDAWTKP